MGAKRSAGRSEVRKFLEDVSVWTNGCWHWIGDVNKDNHGYGCFYHNTKRILAHRYMWELMNDQLIPDGMVIMHTCDNTICVNPNHLKLGTQKQNIDDMITKDRKNTPKGPDHVQYKVTPELFHLARKLRRSGMKSKDIAIELGLGVSTIGHILNTYSRYEFNHEPK